MRSMPKALINLLKGHPNPSLLPTAQIRAASLIAFSDSDVFESGLSYGPEQGYMPLRQQLATWLTKFYNARDPISPQRLCISGGASQNLACILQAYSDPIFTKVWVVSPVYHLACRIFDDNGFQGRLRAVREDQEGIDIGFWQKELIKSDEEERIRGNVRPMIKIPSYPAKIYRHVLYAVPTFSNPSSKTMSLRRRQQLVRVAREHDALIITDDVYDQLFWSAIKSTDQTSREQAILPRVVDVDGVLDGGSERENSDRFGNAVSNGSFSKIVSPGCRTGWAESTEKFVHGLSQVGSTKSGGAPSQLTAVIMASLMESGDLQQHISYHLQPAYKRRWQRMVSAIERHLIPLGASLPKVDVGFMGGYFTWLTLPPQIQADEVAANAREMENLIIAKGSMFRVPSDSNEQNTSEQVRLSFSWEAEDALEEGIERLGKVIRRLQQTSADEKENEAPFG